MMLKKIIALLLAVLVYAQPLWADISRPSDTVCKGPNVSADDNHSMSCTIAADADFIVAGVAKRTAGTISSFTWNGVALTQGVSLSESDASGACHLYYLPAPTTGTQTLAVTVSAGGEFSVIMASFKGVKQTGSIGDTSTATTGAASNTATSISVAVDSVAGYWVVDMAQKRDVTEGITVGADQAQLEQQSSNGAGSLGTVGGMSYEIATGASTTMSWSSATARQWKICGMALIPAVTVVDPPQQAIE